MMLTVQDKKILMASEPIDFRLSINGLVGKINSNINTNAHDGSRYVFYNKKRNRIKILFWDKNGFVLYYKKMDEGKFFLNIDKKGTVYLTQEQLEYILSGYNPKYITHDRPETE